MNTAAPLTPATEAALQAAEIARALDAILASLLALLRGFARYTQALGPLAVPLWNRISRTRIRLARALAHLAAGRTARPRPKRATPARPGPATRIPVRRHGWLGALLDHHIRAHASQLQHLLAQPGAAGIIAASPGAARTLRPLCRMLGADLPAPLRPPPPEPKPAHPRAVRPKPPDPKPTGPGLLPGDRPFQPYVLKAIRYAKRHGLWRPWTGD